MTGILIFFGVILGILVLVGGICVLAKWTMSEDCDHCWERIDTCNDKKMILVCNRCGKIKKIRK